MKKIINTIFKHVATINIHIEINKKFAFFLF